MKRPNNDIALHEDESSEEDSSVEESVGETLRFQARTIPAEQLVKVHYGDNVDLKCFKRWSQNCTFLINKKLCPIPSNIPCAVCNRLTFSTTLRGTPIRSQQWFLNKENDAAYKLITNVYAKTRNDLFRNLRKEEIALRMIPRRHILDDLCNRFRGLKASRHGENKDDVDQILNHYHFKTLTHWCYWKDSFDALVAKTQEDNISHRLYCAGCGVKAEAFFSRDGRLFEKCSTKDCNFFHKVDSTFATVPKKN